MSSEQREDRLGEKVDHVALLAAVIQTRLDQMDSKLDHLVRYVDAHQGRIAQAEGRIGVLEEQVKGLDRATQKNQAGIEYNLKRAVQQDILVGAIIAIIQLFVSIN